MRRRRSRLETCQIYPREIRTDSEGTPTEHYQAPYEVKAETWPAGGKVQAQIYGEHLAYIRNCRIEGKYTTKLEDERLTYVLNGGTLKEKDKITTSQGESYRVVSIKPYKELYLEMEKL